MREAEQKRRIEYIDAMKGIGILAVVLGHCIGTMRIPVNRIILSFHMPLFFFISGMLMSAGYYGKGTSFKLYALKKAKRLLIPQVTMAIINIGVEILNECVLKHEKSFFQIDFLTPFTAWFLIVMFLLSLAMPLLMKLSGKKWIWVAGMAVVLAMFVICNISSGGGRYIEQFFGAVLFAMTGFSMRPYIDAYHDKFRYKGIGIFLFLAGAILSFYNEPVGMYENVYGNKLIFLVAALMGIAAVIDASCAFESLSLVCWFGRNSIIVYITQSAYIRIIKKILSIIITDMEFTQCPGFLLLFLVVVIFEIPTILVINRYFPWLIGGKKTKKSLT